MASIESNGGVLLSPQQKKDLSLQSTGSHLYDHSSPLLFLIDKASARKQMKKLSDALFEIYSVTPSLFLPVISNLLTQTIRSAEASTLLRTDCLCTSIMTAYVTKFLEEDSNYLDKTIGEVMREICGKETKPQGEKKTLQQRKMTRSDGAAHAEELSKKMADLLEKERQERGENESSKDSPKRKGSLSSSLGSEPHLEAGIVGSDGLVQKKEKGKEKEEKEKEEKEGEKEEEQEKEEKGEKGEGNGERQTSFRGEELKEKEEEREKDLTAATTIITTTPPPLSRTPPPTIPLPPPITSLPPTRPITPPPTTTPTTTPTTPPTTTTTPTTPPPPSTTPTTPPPPSEEAKVEKRKLEIVKKILSSLLHEPESAPKSLRSLLRTLKKEAMVKGCDGNVSVGGFFLLRVVAPTIVRPAAYYGTQCPSGETFKDLMDACKLIQNLASKTKPRGSTLQFACNFLGEVQPKVDDYFDTLTQNDDEYDEERAKSLKINISDIELPENHLSVVRDFVWMNKDQLRVLLAKEEYQIPREERTAINLFLDMFGPLPPRLIEEEKRAKPKTKKQKSPTESQKKSKKGYFELKKDKKGGEHEELRGSCGEERVQQFTAANASHLRRIIVHPTSNFLFFISLILKRVHAKALIEPLYSVFLGIRDPLPRVVNLVKCMVKHSDNFVDQNLCSMLLEKYAKEVVEFRYGFIDKTILKALANFQTILFPDLRSSAKDSSASPPKSPLKSPSPKEEIPLQERKQTPSPPSAPKLEAIDIFEKKYEYSSARPSSTDFSRSSSSGGITAHYMELQSSIPSFSQLGSDHVKSDRSSMRKSSPFFFSSGSSLKSSSPPSPKLRSPRLTSSSPKSPRPMSPKLPKLPSPTLSVRKRSSQKSPAPMRAVSPTPELVSSTPPKGETTPPKRDCLSPDSLKKPVLMGRSRTPNKNSDKKKRESSIGSAKMFFPSHQRMKMKSGEKKGEGERRRIEGGESGLGREEEMGVRKKCTIYVELFEAMIEALVSNKEDFPPPLSNLFRVILESASEKGNPSIPLMKRFLIHRFIIPELSQDSLEISPELKKHVEKVLRLFILLSGNSTPSQKDQEEVGEGIAVFPTMQQKLNSYLTFVSHNNSSKTETNTTTEKPKEVEKQSECGCCLASEKNLELHLCLECKKTTCLACLNKRKCHVCSGREQCPRMVQSETRCACCLMLRDLEVHLCVECKSPTCLACLNKRKCHICGGREQCPLRDQETKTTPRMLVRQSAPNILRIEVVNILEKIAKTLQIYKEKMRMGLEANPDLASDDIEKFIQSLPNPKARPRSKIFTKSKQDELMAVIFRTTPQSSSSSTPSPLATQPPPPKPSKKLQAKRIVTQPLNETIVSCEKQHVIHPLVSLLGALVLRGGWEDGLFVEVDGARAVEILDHFMTMSNSPAAELGSILTWCLKEFAEPLIPDSLIPSILLQSSSHQSFLLDDPTSPTISSPTPLSPSSLRVTLSPSPSPPSPSSPSSPQNSPSSLSSLTSLGIVRLELLHLFPPSSCLVLISVLELIGDAVRRKSLSYQQGVNWLLHTCLTGQEKEQLKRKAAKYLISVFHGK